MMKTIVYEYDLDQKVTTMFDEPGVVTMLGFDDGGNKYAVQTAKDSQWYKEDQITDCPLQIVGED